MENKNLSDKKNVVRRSVAFARRHPLLFNFFMVLLVGCGIIWMSLLALDIWTDHGKFQVVPSLRGLTYQQAKNALDTAHMTAELSDSIYDSTMPPGTVVEQSPRPNTKVKTNRKVYLTVTAFTPKMVSLPLVTDMSERQAISTLEGIGLKNVKVSPVASEYKNLVLGVKYNGLPIQPGTRIPSSAVLTLEVGMGIGNEPDAVDSVVVDSPGVDATADEFMFD